MLQSKDSSFTKSRIEQLLSTCLAKTTKAKNEFTSDEKKAVNKVTTLVNKAMGLADKFAIHNRDNTDQTYIPFVLDLIAYLLKRDEDGENSTEDDKSDLLNLEISNDFIVHKVCRREIKKLNNLNVDSQLELLINIAISGGSVSIYDIKQLFLVNDIPKISDEVIEKLKGHPLLNCQENKISFRYDFFNFFFKSLLISKYFNNREIDDLSPVLLGLMADYVQFDNSFSIAVCERLRFSDETVLFAIESIEKINSQFTDNVDTSKRAISAVFSLLLTLLKNSQDKPFNTESCTDLLFQVFGDNSALKGICLVNVSSNSSKPIFNLKGKTIINSYFENYEFFWECPIDQATIFKDSVFKNLQPRKGVKPVFYHSTFADRCDIEDIRHLLKDADTENTIKANTTREKLVKLFNVFCEAGNFRPRKQGQINAKPFVSQLLPKLLALGVIKEFIDPKKPTMQQYIVAPEYRTIATHIEQDSPCIELDRLVSILQGAK